MEDFQVREYIDHRRIDQLHESKIYRRTEAEATVLPHPILCAESVD